MAFALGFSLVVVLVLLLALIGRTESHKKAAAVLNGKLERETKCVNTLRSQADASRLECAQLRLHLQEADQGVSEATGLVEQATQRLAASRADNKALRAMLDATSKELTTYRVRLANVVDGSRRLGMIADGRVDPHALPVHIAQPLRFIRQAAEHIMTAANKLPGANDGLQADKAQGAPVMAGSPASADRRSREIMAIIEEARLNEMMKNCGPFFANTPGPFVPEVQG
jgi:hypothetical protein